MQYRLVAVVLRVSLPLGLLVEKIPERGLGQLAESSVSGNRWLFVAHDLGHSHEKVEESFAQLSVPLQSKQSVCQKPYLGCRLEPNLRTP